MEFVSPLERFALSEEREQCLDAFTPGSADYYYHRGLHLLQKSDGKRTSEIDELMKVYREFDGGRSEQFQRLEARTAVMAHDGGTRVRLCLSVCVARPTT